MESRTLPAWVATWDFTTLDVVRKVVRGRPDLRALGVLYGATRVYSEGEAEVIRRAVEERAASKVAVAVASG